MTVTIDGIKFSSKDIEGTDLDAVKKFCQKNKVQAAIIIYIDKNQKPEYAGIWFRAKAKERLNKIIRAILNIKNKNL